jgi:two-component system, sensor histidine kinase and response regulator
MSLVLIAEDEAALLESFCEIVTGLGHTCITAHDGNEALLKARQQRPDLIITDLMMPGRSGVDLIKALRADPVLCRVPTVLLSAGRPSEADRSQAWMFLSKPLNIDRFEKAVQEGLQAAAQQSERKVLRVAAGEAISPITLAREAMLTWVAHEIKTPLSAALTTSQLAMRGIDQHESPESLKKRLGVIGRQLVRMDELVSSILDAAQLSEGRLELHLEDFDAGEWVAKVAEFWQELHPEHRFSVSDGQGLMIRADRERLRQVLDNLISNAVKYGGPEKKIQLAVRCSDSTISVAVTDDGKGIEPAELRQIFDRFHRVPGQGGRGHGLGLYIAAALARLHGGELSVESEVGRGSTFTLHVPRKELAARAPDLEQVAVAKS